MRIAEIKDLKGGTVRGNLEAVIKASQYSGHNITHMGIVTSRRTISKNRERLAFLDQRCELVDGEVLALPWTVHGQEAQADYLETEQLRVRVGHHLIAQFRARIARER